MCQWFTFESREHWQPQGKEKPTAGSLKMVNANLCNPISGKQENYRSLCPTGEWRNVKMLSSILAQFMTNLSPEYEIWYSSPGADPEFLVESNQIMDFDFSNVFV